jgi:hypothetical protein
MGSRGRYSPETPVASRLTLRELIEGPKMHPAAPVDAGGGSADGVERISCPPGPRLMDWAAQALPARAVLAGGTFNAYPLPAFLPQQVAAWPSENLVDAPALYPAYYERFERTMRQLGVQPFFNAAEGWAERADFVKALAVTHIVVDPLYHGLMARPLRQWPETFATVFDDGAWTVYEVRIPGGGRGKG